MAKAKKKETEFDKLARLIKGEGEDIRKEMADGLSSVRKSMATKEDVAGIMAELGEVKKRLKDVEAAVEDHAGHTKEIDHAFARIAAIEKHLGIKHVVAK